MKIFAIIIYFSLLSLINVTLISDTLSVQSSGEIVDYFQCEAAGKEAECSEDAVNQLRNHNIGQLITIIMIGVLPLFYFAFLLDFSRASLE